MLRTKLVLIISFSWLISCVKATVSYDYKAITINGERKILIAGDIHYPRCPAEMWPHVLKKAKEGGIDVIQSYVFWNGHEPSPGKYNFEGRYDLVRFIKLVKEAGLYFSLRVGPYACGEWNYGGFPMWLKYIPGIDFRTDNQPFKAIMQNFTTKIIDMMKAEKLFEPQGGPIIVCQIENEYELNELLIGTPGKNYAQWAAHMALAQNTGTPWIMCKQGSAPDPIINTCNGYYCEGFSPNKPYKPKMWTEAWTAWFLEFGAAIPARPVEDLAYSVLKFIQVGGSFISYYMYYGGTNFGRTGGQLYATSYDMHAPIDEYGLLREPNWGHLRDLHKVIKLCEPALITSDPNIFSIGKNQEAHVFKSDRGCSAFLSNNDNLTSARVTFENKHYDLPPWSITVLPDCKTSVFNTARIGSQTTQKKLTPAISAFSWQSYHEEISTRASANTFIKDGLGDQKLITGDASDYLWYMIEVNIDPNEAFLKTGQDPTLSVLTFGHALTVFINGQHTGFIHGDYFTPKRTFNSKVKLRAGINNISLLSAIAGLPGIGIGFDTQQLGVMGPVTLHGLNDKTRDLSKLKWSYKIGLEGETLGLFTEKGSSSVKWVDGQMLAKKQPLVWYKAVFDAPAGNDPLALDMSTMGKGMVWINGQSIGRHWPTFINTAVYHCDKCNYAGLFDESKCRSGCGQATQRVYHLPRSWLKPTGNLLVVFEEIGGDPTGITLQKVTAEVVCADIVEEQPTVMNWSMITKGEIRKPEASLSCPSGQKISTIKFASYGMPQGTCGSFKEGTCHAHKSYDPLNQNCIGKQSCSVTVTPEAFGGDPCPHSTGKKLSVEAVCSS